MKIISCTCRRRSHSPPVALLYHIRTSRSARIISKKISHASVHMKSQSPHRLSWSCFRTAHAILHAFSLLPFQNKNYMPMPNPSPTTVYYNNTPPKNNYTHTYTHMRLPTCPAITIGTLKFKKKNKASRESSFEFIWPAQHPRLAQKLFKKRHITLT